MSFITFSTLGSHGRLGNQMFQYAALKALANKLNCEPLISNNLNTRIHHGQNCLLECFNINCKRSDEVCKIQYREDNCGGYYDPNIWNLSPNTDLFGHYECELYFEHIKDQIKQEFELKEEYQKIAETLINNIKQPNHEIVGIHIRRGDKENEINTSLEFITNYLNEALPHFKNPIFLIFSGGSQQAGNDNSEDILWCKENIKLNGNSYYSKCDTIRDFSLMVNCDHLILNSTSTIGWWAGYLNKNPNKKIIVPKQSRLVGSNYVKGEHYYSKEFIQI